MKSITDSLLERARKWESEHAEVGALVGKDIRDAVARIAELEKILAQAVLDRADLRALAAEVRRLKRGEFICQKCGLRKDGEGSGVSAEF